MCGSPIRRACQCGEVLKGVDQALAVQGVRHGLHAGDAARRADGFVGRRLRGLLPIWRHQGARQAPHDRSCRSRAAQDRSAACQRADGHAGPRRRRQGDAGPDRRRLRRAVRQYRPRAAGGSGARSISARFAALGDRLAFTTDSFVVDPLFFPGGDIGKLAVYGTVNDLAVGGAVPLFLSCAVIIEEGVPVEVLRRVSRVHGRSRRASPAFRSSPATPRWCRRAPATSCSSPRPASA